MDDGRDRRAFVRAATAAGAAWATAAVADVEGALAFAGQASRNGAVEGSSALSAPQTSAIEAAAARIVPAVDGRPGAREAGAVHVIDRALATFNVSQTPLYMEGIATLNRRAAEFRPGPTFAALPAPQQDEVLRGVESTPFFQALRFDTLVGTFALPTWGGNRDHLGWHLLGFEHAPRFQAPFGYYDADANRRA